MARIRSYRPEIWEDERFGTLSKDARLLLLAVLSAADDAGRFHAHPLRLAGLFPYDRPTEADVASWLAEIRARDLVLVYEVRGVQLGEVQGWSDRQHMLYQSIDRPSASRLPGPPRGPVPVPEPAPSSPAPAACGIDSTSPPRADSEPSASAPRAVGEASAEPRRAVDDGSMRKGSGSGSGSGKGRDPDPEGGSGAGAGAGRARSRTRAKAGPGGGRGGGARAAEEADGGADPELAELVGYLEQGTGPLSEAYRVGRAGGLSPDRAVAYAHAQVRRAAAQGGQ